MEELVLQRAIEAILMSVLDEQCNGSHTSIWVVLILALLLLLKHARILRLAEKRLNETARLLELHTSKEDKATTGG